MLSIGYITLFLTFLLNKVFPTSNIKACQLFLYILVLIWDLRIFAIPIRPMPNNINATGSELKIRILLLLNKMTIKIVIDIINFNIGNLTILSVKKFMNKVPSAKNLKLLVIRNYLLGRCKPNPAMGILLTNWLQITSWYLKFHTQHHSNLWSKG